MMGIGLFPFVLLPWVVIGPLVWACKAQSAWAQHRAVAWMAAMIAALSILIPLISLLYSIEDAAGAALVTATLSLATYLSKLILGPVLSLLKWAYGGHLSP
ncbi:hypothetical protein WG899_03270 [Paucibacter sp. AS339]|uniref:hypothetical protein n=1 Tax=Paucibacter hankyongi TaxID=3133434 RepID=UPI00309DE05A